MKIIKLYMDGLSMEQRMENLEYYTDLFKNHHNYIIVPVNKNNDVVIENIKNTKFKFKPTKIRNLKKHKDRYNKLIKQRGKFDSFGC